MHMHQLSVQKRTPCNPIPIDRPFLQTNWYRTVMRAEAQFIAVFQDYACIISVAKLASAFDDGLEHWVDVGRRRRDHIENVRAAGLVGQRLGKISRARLYLVEQADVLYGDHR